MLTKVALYDEYAEGEPELIEDDPMYLCGPHFLYRWGKRQIEILETDIPDEEADCDDCQMEKALRNFLNE